MTQYATYRAVRTFGCLDGLRALAIVAVVWHHAGPEYAWAATQRGYLGVDLFFVISGFLIVTLLLRERERNGSIALGSFYMRRALRIFPLFYGALAAYWLVAYVKGGILAEQIHDDLPFAATYVANWVSLASPLVITWSLAAEEQFYLVWPAVEKLGGRVAALVVAGALAACVAIQLLCAHTGFWPGAPTFLRGCSFTPILIGVVSAHALHSPNGFARMRTYLGSARSAPIALLMLVGLCSIPSESTDGIQRIVIAVACGALVASCVVREDNGLAQLLRTRPMVRLGIVSYGIYLLHEIPTMAAFFVTRRLELEAKFVSFVLVLVAAWAMAEISYRTFERYFLRLKKRWSVSPSAGGTGS